MVTKDIEDLSHKDLSKGDNHCLQLQHKAGSQHWDPLGLPGAAQQHQGKANPSLLAIWGLSMKGFPPNSTGDNCVSSWWVLPWGNPIRPNCCSRPSREQWKPTTAPQGTAGSETVPGELCPSLLCHWDGDWGNVLSTSLAHPPALCPRALWAQIMKSQNGLGWEET